MTFEDAKMKQLSVGMMVVVMLAGVGEAEEYSTDPMHNWPAWRGPLANGTAPHADPPLVWNRTNNLKWKLDLPGQSNATPIVWADNVFVVTAVETDLAVDRLAPPKMEPPGGYRTERPKNYYRFLVYCVDRETGRPLADAVRLPDLREIYASPLGAAGRVYIVGRDGNTLVVRNEAELDVLAVNRLDDPIDASPAAVGRDLFLRSKRRLYCISRTSEAAEVQRRNQAK